MLQKVKFFHFIVILVMLSSFIFSPDLVKAEIDFKKSRKYSTPELIHISYKKNEIDLDTAHLYLARVLHDTKKIAIDNIKATAKIDFFILIDF